MCDAALKDCDLNVKIVDFGMSYWVDEKFTKEIQSELEEIHGLSTLRSLEMILRKGFDTSADIWFTACIAFELATGSSLIEYNKGKGYSW